MPTRRARHARVRPPSWPRGAVRVNRLFVLLAKGIARVRGHHAVRIRGLDFKCDPRNYDFWNRVADGLWEPETYEILDRHLGPESVYCDVGNWIGQTVIFAARKCRAVYCFEPDRFVYKDLLLNLQLNGLENVFPLNLALTDSDRVIEMGSFAAGFGLGETSVLDTAPRGNGMRALGISWATWMRLVRPPRIDFLKIDIEGGEFPLLPTLAPYLAEHRPLLHLSLHGPRLAATERDAAMARVRDAVRVYGRCRDEEGREIPVDALTADAFASTYRTLLFGT